MRDVELMVKSRPKFGHLPISQEDKCWIKECSGLQRLLCVKNFMKDFSEGGSKFDNFLCGHSNIDSNKKEDLCHHIKDATEFSLKHSTSFNVNCLINTQLKQCHQIWNSFIGRKLLKEGNHNKFVLINSLPVKGSSKKRETTGIEAKNAKKKNGNKFFFGTDDKKLLLGHHMTYFNCSENWKLFKLEKHGQKLLKIPNGIEKNEKKIKALEIVHQESFNIPIIPCSENDVNSQLLLEEKKGDDIEERSISDVKSLVQLPYRRQNLSRCIKNIFNASSNKIEMLKKSKTSLRQISAGEQENSKRENQVCIICNMTFPSSKDFICHLSYHESVDKFSCKECKVYFPTLEKFQLHQKKFHFVNGLNSACFAK